MDPREARLKIERAEHHISDLERLIKSFCESKGVRFISMENDRETGEHVLKVFLCKQLPNQLGLVLGDAIHNLKTALDYAWYSTILSDIGVDDSIKFPIYPSRKHLEQFIRKSSEQKSVVQIADTLLDLIQPYKGGNGDALYHLHRLDISDKHRLLIPQMQVARLSGLWAEDESGKRYKIDMPNTLQMAPLTVRYRGPRKLQIAEIGSLDSTVVFGVGTPMDGHVVIPTLRTMVAHVTSALEALDSAVNVY